MEASNQSKRREKRQIENFKVILLGNMNVGKTCIFDRITRNDFNEYALPTLSHTFAQKVVKVTKMLDEKGKSMQGLDEMKQEPANWQLIP